MATDLDFGAWKPELQQRAAEFVTNQAIGSARQSLDVSTDAQEVYTAGQLALYQRLAELTGRSLALPAGDTESAPIDIEASTPKPQTRRGRPKGATDKQPRKPRTPAD